MAGRRLEERACIVTGGSAGIGLAICRPLLGEGAQVVFCGTNEETGTAAASTLGNGAFNAIPGLLDRWFASIPVQRPSRADEMAAIVAFLASDEPSYMHGSIIVADGGVDASTGQPTQMPLA